MTSFKEILEKRLKLKKKFRERKNIFAAWTSLAHPSITEILGKSQVDFVGIDIEHGTFNQEQVQRTIAAAQSEGVLCLPRIASHNPEMIKRVLDSGADGLIVPMVNNVEELKKIVSWCTYPTEGIRSFGISRAQGYGFDFDQYVQSWNESKVLILQIESIEGVNHIDQLLDHPAVDGVMIGPYDLSGTLGVPGQLEHPKVKEAAAKVIAASLRYKKTCGTQDIDPQAESVQAKIKEGYNFIVLSSDVFLLWKWSEKMKKLIQSISH